MGAVITYEQGARSASEVQGMIDELITEMDQDGDLAQELSNHGIESSILKQEGVARVRQRAAGFDATQLIVDLLGPMTYDVWKYVILPRLARRHGADVLGQEKEQDGGPTAH